MTKIDYQKIPVSKKESEVINFLETGSNNFWDAYYMYKNRKKVIDRPSLTIKSWFNSILKNLKSKGLFCETPFVIWTNKVFLWNNPGIKGNKAEFICESIQEDVQDLRVEINKII